jgi:hypothetical protein
MKLRLLQAYIRYRLRARHHNGHGIHSPFMYEFARSVFFAPRKAEEAQRKQERTEARIAAFCEKHGLRHVAVTEKKDADNFGEGCIATLQQPYCHPELRRLLEQRPMARVEVDCWSWVIVFAVDTLQKQKYVVRA